MNIESHINNVVNIIKTVAIDQRDEWPINSKSYIKGKYLSDGYFGAVRFAECQNPIFGFNSLETRRCVIKTIYLRRRFESIFFSIIEKKFSDKYNPFLVKEKLFCFYRKCRHENILHSHAVFLDIDLHIVYPRCYVLKQLIDLFQIRKNSDPIPVKIIAMIIRQLCFALEFLSKIDIQPQNVFLTRVGTVKLAHFSQSSVFFSKSEKTICVTPVGKKEFMCYEKLFNLYEGKSIENTLQYSCQSDIWSLGVLALSMITYFPNEKGHKLDNNFVFLMQKKKIPFIWLIAEMIQLRSRIIKSGGEELKIFLSDHLLSISNENNSAAYLLETPQMINWCSKKVNDDKLYIRKYFINEVDFVNFFKLEENAPNYNNLETKDIPVEFYLNEKYKQLKSHFFLIKLFYLNSLSKFKFNFSDPKLFRFLYMEFLNEKIHLLDLIPLDFEIKELIYNLVKSSQNLQMSSDIFRRKKTTLFNKNISVEIEVSFASTQSYSTSSFDSDYNN